MKGSKQSADTSSQAFSSYANKWVTSIATQVKETSLAKYRNIVERYLKPYFGRRTIAEIEAREIAQFLQTLNSQRSNSRALSSSTITAILATLRRALNFARFELSLPPLDFKNLNPKRVRRASIDVLSAREQKKLREYLLEHIESPSALGVFLSLTYGLRIGEVCALAWRDVDFDSGTLSVVHTMTRIQTFEKARGKRTSIRVTEPKTPNSIRKIPLSRETLDLLEAMPERSPDAFLLTGRADRHIEPRTLENHFKRILRSIGIRKVNFHVLRHSFATRWVESGLDVKALSELLGHSSPGITLSLYAHPSMESKRKNLDALNRKLYGKDMSNN